MDSNLHGWEDVIQNCANRLEKAEQEISRAQLETHEALQRLKHSSPSSFQEHLKRLSAEGYARSDFSPGENTEEKGLSNPLDVGSVAAINSMNSIAKARKEGAVLEKEAQIRIAAWEAWKEQNSAGSDI